MRLSNEIPQAANRVVDGMHYRVCATDRVVGAELASDAIRTDTGCAGRPRCEF
jgi:hypothetical protein